LLFSQFKIMLDILEDYLEGRKFSFGRIDGTVTGEKRQQVRERRRADGSMEVGKNPSNMRSAGVK
jgi:SNF2 family DNA or RNA helicase